RILQINDVYKIEGLANGTSGGLARVRSLRSQLGADGTPVLLLHAGDTLYPSVMSKYLEAKPMIDALNLLDGDAAKSDPLMTVTFGNHEFDKSDATILLARLADSQFQWVASNSRFCKAANDCNQSFSALSDHVSDTMFMDVAGTRVGLFGLLLPMTKSYMTTTDLKQAATDSIALLRAGGAKFIVAVTHENMPDDVTLVKSVPGIDLVIGGHDHLYAREQVGRTWIAKGDADAKSVLVYDVIVGKTGVDVTPRRVMLDESIPKDPAVDADVAKWMNELNSKIPGGATTRLGDTKYLLEGTEPAVRGKETALGNLLVDAMRDKMQTEIAFLNGGSIRINDDIPAGAPITNYDMEGIFYYTNALVTFNLTGQQLLDILRNSVSLADMGDGRFLQVSGIAFKYHPQNGTFVVNAEDVTINGAPLDLAKSYTTSTIEYLYTNGGGDGYTLFASDATRPPKTSSGPAPDHRAVVEDYIRALPGQLVTTNVEGRIVRE
ncbi:MAG TPA: 5'-nucleotidase C-terminal domain-containing protein, partial [Thermoanaerobaculia bacterium]|nr:5'-nucleotidase C-terminal domain-containing protein [Thermoanaerobaculia bacterium]